MMMYTCLAKMLNIGNSSLLPVLHCHLRYQDSWDQHGPTRWPHVGRINLVIRDGILTYDKWCSLPPRSTFSSYLCPYFFALTSYHEHHTSHREIGSYHVARRGAMVSIWIRSTFSRLNKSRCKSV